MPRRNDMSKIMTMALRPAALICFLLVSAASVIACSISVPRYKVQSSFLVIVEHQKAPISGIEVALYRDQGTNVSDARPLLTRFSDTDGTIKFEGLAPGPYFIEIRAPGGGEAAYLNVGAAHKEGSRNEIKLQWPRVDLVKAKALKGRLVSNDAHKPFASVRVKLWKPGTQVALGNLTAGQDGRFEFSQNEPGIYILEVAAVGEHPAVYDGDPQGWIGVELVPAGAQGADVLNLALSETTCGLRYSECIPAPSIKVASRKLVVLGPTGAAVQAFYDVISDVREFPVPGETDASGGGAFRSGLMGPHKLWVSSSGLVPLEQDVEFVAIDPQASPLKIVLAAEGSNGACSKATLENDAAQK
ncbi:MAG TPA: hypothetical protein VKE93_09665 [Candidatus Angelobacter sp.]|nr:hypothetical protein [Candidatus Angelobacter sp.]